MTALEALVDPKPEPPSLSIASLANGLHHDRFGSDEGQLPLQFSGDDGGIDDQPIGHDCHQVQHTVEGKEGFG